MANINLLPWRERVREERKKLFVIQLGISAVLALVVLGVTYLIGDQSIESQNAINKYLRDQIAVLDGKLTEIRDLQDQKKRLTARMAVIQQLQGNRPVIVHLFDELVRTLPDGVYYTSVTRTNDIISIEGVAESNSRISTLMRDLDASDWFADPQFKQVSASGNESGPQNINNKFELTVKITTPTQEK
ncbi:MAG TPA: PilN domain-containing protein [Candidatus Acidoferrum sp.]|nr:PilN domain-containing protein [Candidatus Acidoferrum sp.]